MGAVLIALAFALGVAPAVTQDADEPALVDALVVNARTPGPAWWSVGKGEAKVWVLGMGVSIPASESWDATVFERRVRATRRVIVIPPSKTSFSREILQADRNWIDELTDTERARLAEIAEATGRKVEAYGKFRPNFAGLLIKSDLDARVKPKPGKAQDFEAKASRLGATLLPVGEQVARGVKDSFQTGGHDSLTCVRWALRPRDPVATRQQRAQAWTRGDVRALLIGPTAYDPCVQAMSAMQAKLENNEGATVNTIAGLLDRGESAVAFVHLTALLREGGVLDQLRKRGYRIETPAQIEDDDG